MVVLEWASRKCSKCNRMTWSDAKTCKQCRDRIRLRDFEKNKIRAAMKEQRRKEFVEFF